MTEGIGPRTCQHWSLDKDITFSAQRDPLITISPAPLYLQLLDLTATQFRTKLTDTITPDTIYVPLISMNIDPFQDHYNCHNTDAQKLLTKITYWLAYPLIPINRTHAASSNTAIPRPSTKPNNTTANAKQSFQDHSLWSHTFKDLLHTKSTSPSQLPIHSPHNKFHQQKRQLPNYNRRSNPLISMMPAPSTLIHPCLQRQTYRAVIVSYTTAIQRHTLPLNNQHIQHAALTKFTLKLPQIQFIQPNN